MLAVIIAIICAYIVSIKVFDTLFPQLKGFSRIGLIAIGSLFYLVWAAFLNTWLFGFETGYWAMGVITAVPALEQLVGGLTTPKLKKVTTFFNQYKMGTACVVVICLLIGALLHTRLYLPGENGLFSGGSTWADLSLHSSLITHFAQQDRLHFDSPIWSGTRNTYPWLFDMYTAWLVRAGFSLRQALLISSWQALVPLAVLFVALGKSLSLKKAGLIAATMLFFLAGGIGFIYFPADVAHSGKNVWEFLQDMPFQYTNNSIRNIHFSTPITDILLPQRGALVGLGIIFGIVVLLNHWLKTHTKRSMICVGLMIGLLPLIHAHLFFIGVGLLLLAMSISWWWGGAGLLALGPWVIALGVALLPAIPQLNWLLSEAASASFVAVDPLWKFSFSANTSAVSLVSFVLLNFSVAFALAGYSIRHFHSQKYSLNILLWLAMVGILLLTLIFRFQPHDYDNIKFMVVALAFAALLAGTVLESWWPKKRMVVIAIIIVGSLSGLLSVIREFTSNHLMFSYADIKMVEDVSSTIPPDSVLATAPDHHNVFGAIGGYAVYSGYPGWLWSYGIDYSQRVSTLELAYAGNSEALAQLYTDGITHLVISPIEMSTYNVSALWQTQPVVFEKGSVKVIELNDALVELSRSWNPAPARP